MELGPTWVSFKGSKRSSSRGDLTSNGAKALTQRALSYRAGRPTRRSGGYPQTGAPCLTLPSPQRQPQPPCPARRYCWLPLDGDLSCLSSGWGIGRLAQKLPRLDQCVPGGRAGAGAHGPLPSVLPDLTSKAGLTDNGQVSWKDTPSRRRPPLCPPLGSGTETCRSAQDHGEAGPWALRGRPPPAPGRPQGERGRARALIQASSPSSSGMS